MAQSHINRGVAFKYMTAHIQLLLIIGVKGFDTPRLLWQLAPITRKGSTYVFEGIAYA